VHVGVRSHHGPGECWIPGRDETAPQKTSSIGLTREHGCDAGAPCEGRPRSGSVARPTGAAGDPARRFAHPADSTAGPTSRARGASRHVHRSVVVSEGRSLRSATQSGELGPGRPGGRTKAPIAVHRAIPRAVTRAVSDPRSDLRGAVLGGRPRILGLPVPFRSPAEARPAFRLLSRASVLER